MTIAEISQLKIPFVGVGCIVTRADRQWLLVRNHGGGWGPPGGHLDFGESPETCAARETREETGVRVENMEFVAVTNDLLTDVEKHYITLWFRAEAIEPAAGMADPEEIAEIGWFTPGNWPEPRALYFENLLTGRSLPAKPANLPLPPSL